MTTYPTYNNLSLTEALIERQGLEQTIAERMALSQVPFYFLGCLEILEAVIAELSRQAIL